MNTIAIFDVHYQLTLKMIIIMNMKMKKIAIFNDHLNCMKCSFYGDFVMNIFTIPFCKMNMTVLGALNDHYNDHYNERCNE